MKYGSSGKITVTGIRISKNELGIEFLTTHPQFFRSTIFFSIYNESVADTPCSIAIIPFIVNILPIAWLADLTIEVDEIDEDFYNHIKDIKNGYIAMYPSLKFKGAVKAKNIIHNEWAAAKSALLFSGGVDAFASLVAHADEHPDLITVQGSDIHLDEHDAWNRVLEQNREVCKDFEVKQRTVQSNYCEFIDYQALMMLIQDTGENWWHGFQHGIGLIGQTAPLAFLKRYSTVYIASSYTSRDNVTCASDPSIDNHVHIGNCNVVHDQYEYDRIDKTKHIAEYAVAHKRYPYLRVCYMSNNGLNCCHCEKCLRTAAAIAILGYNPEDFGFTTADKIFRNSRIKVLSRINFSACPLWDDLRTQIEILKPDMSSPNLKHLKWVGHTQTKQAYKSLPVRAIRFLKRRFPVISKIFDI